MITLAYLLKMVICSALLFGYYYLFLRNRHFHQWNRFYLLASVVLSLLIPCFTFSIQKDNPAYEPVQILQVVQSGAFFESETTGSASQLTLEKATFLIYVLVSLVLTCILIRSVIRITKIIRTHAKHRYDNIYFLSTDVKGTPFSFLNYILWNKDIDVQSETGHQIFQHEVVHIKEKHTLDKLFLQTVLLFFWCNPFFWLVRKELSMIHEFIADKKAIGTADASALAAMILQASYPTHFNSLTNSFFQSPIKRRITMLTKQPPSKIRYVSRLMALPLIAFTALAFTVNTKAGSFLSGKLENEITVVIDAGHGGANRGSQFNNVYEDELVLNLAKQIQAVNHNEKVKIVLTRTDASSVSLKERVEIAERNKADLFISLHIAAAENPGPEDSGIEVSVPGKNPAYQLKSEILGSTLLHELNNVYTAASTLRKRDANIYVLDNNTCPSVIIECGYITNEKDRSFLQKLENQKTVALSILSAIERYALQNENMQGSNSIALPVTDTVPSIFYKGKKVQEVQVIQNGQKVRLIYPDNSREVISMEEAKKNKIQLPPPPPPIEIDKKAPPPPPIEIDEKAPPPPPISIDEKAPPPPPPVKKKKS